MDDIIVCMKVIEYCSAEKMEEFYSECNMEGDNINAGAENATTG